MSAYVEGLSKSNYVPNIIVLFGGEYFSIRQPDSGLVVKDEYNGLVSRVQISPTRIDPLRPSNTTSSSSFNLVDINNEVSKLFLDKSGFRVGEEVKIFIGRSFENLDFSEYFELPAYDLKGFNKIDGGYSFKATERKDRLNNGAFSTQTKLAVDILAGTTSISVQDASNFPSSGFAKIGDEFISWSSVNSGNLVGAVRGEFGSTVEAHESGEDVFLVEEVDARNVIDFLLQFLISGGGGGVYDVLNEGAGIDESLVDVDQFLEIKDSFFSSNDVSFLLYNLNSNQKFLEDEVFLPFGLRLRSNSNGKLGLALLNRNVFEIDAPVIDETNSLKVPRFSIDENRISNRVRIFWNYSEGKGEFQNVNEFTSAGSISQYGPTKWQDYEFKGISDLPTIEVIAALYLERFSLPRPQIDVEANNSTSFLNVGDKTDFFSSRLPTENGNLEFVSTLEVLKQSYKVSSGTVRYSLAFTSFSGIRQCFIAPSSTIISHADQKTVTLAAGQGDHYRVGWIMALYDNSVRDYATGFRNEIVSITNDTITFLNEWPVTLVDNVSRLMFADYDEVAEQQKRFCFVSNNNNQDFNDNKRAYQITIG